MLKIYVLNTLYNLVRKSLLEAFCLYCKIPKSTSRLYCPRVFRDSERISQRTPGSSVDNIKKKQVRYDQNKDKDPIPFEIQIPQNAKRSFNASHSEFYWLLEAKVDIDGRRDIRVNQVIQVLFSNQGKGQRRGIWWSGGSHYAKILAIIP
jgi:hypothetical protein